MPDNSREQELIKLEHEFWDTMKTKDGAKAGSMTRDGCVVVGAQGVGAIDGKMMEKMMADGKWDLNSYTFDEKTMQVHFVNDDVAVIAYKVNEDLTVEGKKLPLEANDASDWVREGGKWRCALHTESVAGDPYGRDKVKKV
jgi:hypothetical protein